MLDVPMSFCLAAGFCAVLKSSEICVEVLESNVNVLPRYMRYFRRGYDLSDVNQGSWWIMGLNTFCLLTPVLLELLMPSWELGMQMFGR
jgi:hypothetical protein